MNIININKHKIKAVLFDMDGTVLNTEPIHKEAWEKAMSQFGLESRWDLLYRCIGLTDKAMKKLFFDEIGLENFDEVYEAARSVSRVIKAGGVPVKKGFSELYTHLKDKGIKSAIVTSSSHEAAEKDLGRAGILDCFDLIIGFGDYIRSKPHPEPYLKAAETLGFEPEECIAVEDSGSGVTSAVNARIKCVYIKDIIDIPDIIKNTAYRTSDSLFDVIEIIEKINNNYI